MADIDYKWKFDRQAQRIIIPRALDQYSDTVVMECPTPQDEATEQGNALTAEHIVNLHNAWWEENHG